VAISPLQDRDASSTYRKNTPARRLVSITRALIAPKKEEILTIHWLATLKYRYIEGVFHLGNPHVARGLPMLSDYLLT